METMMLIGKKLLVSASVAVILLLPVCPSLAMTQADCESLFAKADTNNDGSLGKSDDQKWEARIYHLLTISKREQDIVSKDEFMLACRRGRFDGM
jgi:hypothetical protein